VVEEMRKRNKVRIKTNISKNDVKYIDDFPTNEVDRKVY
jgi:hypothetical protein